MALTTFRRVLQSSISPEDSTWAYQVSGIPDAHICNAAGYIKSCTFICNAEEQEVRLSLTKIPPNRAISTRGLDSFIHVAFGDFRLQAENGEPAPFKTSAAYVASFLKSGLRINDTEYHFYGHSQSQLKSKTCFLISEPKHEANRIIESLGDFSRLKTVAKKAKRIGLLFSTAHAVMDVEPYRVRDIDDIENQDYVFTDGCGLIAQHCARMLTRKRPIVFRNQRYHPTVFQIRYRGYKGVVTVEPLMKQEIWLHLRKSMKKFSGVSDMGFAIVEFSKVK